MSTETIIRGENRLLVRSLRLSDGSTPLLVSSLALAKATLLQGRTVRAVYTLGTDDELRAGSATDELVLELTSARSAALAEGPVTVRWELRVADADFEAEPDVFIDKIDETPWRIVA